MNRLGMVINISHSSDETIEQALEVSSKPLVATHHGLRMVNNIPRNMPEHLMRKIAAKGGVIGFQIGNEFHNVKAFQWATQNAGKPFWDTTEIASRKGQLTIEEIDRKVAPQFPMVGLNMPEEIKFAPDGWIEVVEKAIAIVGEDHVALGSDFDGGPTPPRGIRDVSDTAMLTDAMLQRGWSESRIRKFLGLNMLRVFREITEPTRR
jgi:membrane dipeptidase